MAERPTFPSSSSYRAPLWLRWPRAWAGHLQTIVPAVLAKRPPVAYRRERWDTPDNDFVDIDWVEFQDRQTPLVVLFHGLEGSADSHYARHLMAGVHALGWLGAVAHFRGCSGEPNRTLRAYHSGDATEVGWILARLHAAHPHRRLYAVGISLGGNALAKWLGQAGGAAQFVARAAIVCAPLDLAAGGKALSSGFNLFYTWLFLRTLKSKTIAKIRRHPELARLIAEGAGLANDRHKDLAAAAIQAIRGTRDLHDFDDLYTGPIHGYASADDYWLRASAKPDLAHIRVPTLVLNALNDPFVPSASLPHANAVSDQVRLEQPAHGGHVGFMTTAGRGRVDWLAQRLLDWFREETN